MYPENDNQYEDTIITKATSVALDGHYITMDDGWSFFIPATSPIVPKVGDSLRLYGRGVGYSVRGAFINGTKVFYRTEAEQTAHTNNEIYGADCAEWLRRWDSGGTVWSISMGGLGPGYEQAIQIAVVELLRHLVAYNYNTEQWAIDDAAYKADCDAIDAAVLPIINPLGLSGAQWGAAKSLAMRLYMHGPVGVLACAAAADRRIQVSKTLPSL